MVCAQTALPPIGVSDSHPASHRHGSVLSASYVFSACSLSTESREVYITSQANASHNQSRPAIPIHEYEFRPRKDRSGVDLISDVLPFGRLW
jgi:hypothetical protein